MHRKKITSWTFGSARLGLLNQRRSMLGLIENQHDAEPIIREGSLGSKNLDEYLSEVSSCSGCDVIHNKDPKIRSRLQIWLIIVQS